MNLRLVAALSAVIFLLSCKSENKKGIVEKSTPSEIAETAYAHLIKGEYDEYLSCVQSYDSIPQRYHNSLVNVLKQAAENEKKERRGMVSAKAIAENTNEKATYSVVRIYITYGDSTKEEIAVPVIKYNGRWRLK